VRESLEKLSSVARAVGPVKAGAAAAAWLVARRFRIFVVDVDRIVHKPLEDGWEELGERAAALIPQINPGARPQTIRRLLEQGATCYAARRGGRIVHYRWYTSQPVWLDFLQLRWVPQPGDYTTLSAFTIPEYRGRGLSRRYSDAGLARARASGLKRAVFTVAWWNVPAVVLERDRTATRVGDVTLWKLGPWRVHSRSGAVTIEGADLTVDRQNA
jgi:GNAT superfamily N-acetyltransferase